MIQCMSHVKRRIAISKIFSHNLEGTKIFRMGGAEPDGSRPPAGQGALPSIFVVSCSISVPSPDNSQHYTTKTPQYVAFKLMILAIASCLSGSLRRTNIRRGLAVCIYFEIYFGTEWPPRQKLHCRVRRLAGVFVAAGLILRGNGGTFAARRLLNCDKNTRFRSYLHSKCSPTKGN